MTLPPATASASLPQARRLAVAASGIHPAALPKPTVESVLSRLRIIQLDSLNVLARAHQPTFTSRLPASTSDDVDAALREPSHPWPSSTRPTHRP
ncbi:hypothetical protein AB0H45_32385 [Streptomyces atroolivaceus]|uniref:hypothetical protein n=1 Tax=Streptomyces atroolivaceus TaxID=66869 RepID=UPI0033C5522A